ncbi:MAG: helix-turn-helix transcriptional regulator [Rickettsiales bacterium]|nr:helix-turn-helix transcriptional regulator [Rickettsiales bacterium]
MAHPVDEYVGKRLRDRRTRLGMSQEALAKNSGITFQQVQKYERATNRIAVSRIYEFASVLRVPVSFFFDGMIGDNEYALAEPREGFKHEERPLDTDLKEIIEAYRKIEDPEMRKSVKTLVKGIASGDAIL